MKCHETTSQSPAFIWSSSVLPAGRCRAVVRGCGAGGQRGALFQRGCTWGHHGRSGGQSQRHWSGCGNTHTHTHTRLNMMYVCLCVVCKGGNYVVYSDLFSLFLIVSGLCLLWLLGLFVVCTIKVPFGTTIKSEWQKHPHSCQCI